MFKNYILAQELFERTGFASSNISMVIKSDGILEGDDFLKFKSVVLLNKKSENLPDFIMNAIKTYEQEFTDLSDLIPYIHFMEIVGHSTTLIKDKIEVVDVGQSSEEGVRPKKFIRIVDEDFKKLFFDENIMKVTIDKYELDGLIKEKLIDGYIHLSNKKTLVWY